MIEQQSPPTINTPDGLPGFADLRSWELERSDPDAIFALLRSVERPGIGLLVAEPWALAPGYEPDLPDPDLCALGAQDANDVAVLVVANFDVERRQAWLNLAAPIVVHVRTGNARQMILDRQGWPLRHPVTLGA